MDKQYKVATFTRVSTMDQHSSILNQQEIFNQWFKNNQNSVLYDSYVDEGISGAKAYKRVNWLKMIADAKTQKFDIILCKSFSRFGRNQRETLSVIAELREKGIRFIFLEDNLDSERDMANFGLMAWLAEKEANSTSERLKYIWSNYDARGKIHAPKPAYGYEWCKNTKNYVINDDEAKIVKKIFNWYINGDGYNAICRRLTLDSIKTKAGGKWQSNTIAKILTNETYMGTLVQAKSRTIDATTKNSRKIDKKEWIRHINNHKAIINKEIFNHVQEIIEKRKTSAISCYKEQKMSRHSNKSLFSNLLICLECSSHMTIKRKKRLNYIPYYQCRNYDLNSLKSGHVSNSIKEIDLLTIIKNEVVDLSEKNNKLLDNMQVKVFNELATLKKDIDKIQNKIDKQIEVANNLLVSYSNKIVEKELYELQSKSLNGKVKELLIEKNRLERRYQDLRNTKDIEIKYKGIERLVQLPVEKWDNKMLKDIIENIYIGISGEVEIKFKFKY
ncbi:MAG: recombinase family protein [Sarcina sp.]